MEAETENGARAGGDGNRIVSTGGTCAVVESQEIDMLSMHFLSEIWVFWISIQFGCSSHDIISYDELVVHIQITVQHDISSTRKLTCRSWEYRCSHSKGKEL